MAEASQASQAAEALLARAASQQEVVTARHQAVAAVVGLVEGASLAALEFPAQRSSVGHRVAV